MAKKIISNLVFMLTLFILISQLSSAAHYVCLNEGEKLASGWICQSQCCANICVDDNNYQTNPSRCYGLPGCSCGNNNVENDLTPPEVTINEPEEQHAYSSRSIPFNIDVNEVAYRLEYQEKGQERRGWTRLCPGKCVHYEGKRSFNDGEHTLTVRAIDGNGNIGTSEITFYVDSHAPRIRKLIPSERDFCNGNFSIEYAEDNVESISLFYKDSSMSNFAEIKRNDCPSGRSAVCTFHVSSLSQGELEYYFTITDKSQTVESRHYTVKVDTVPPALAVTKPAAGVYNKRRIDFNISVNELSDISYIDENENLPREMTLCRHCMSYTRAKSFRDGHHKIKIIARDNAGNTNTREIEFTLDSRKPRIIRSYPARRKYGNGTFTVIYSETSPVRVTLYYSYDGENFKNVSNYACPGGRRAECSIRADNIEEGRVYYYFEIEDIAGSVVKQRRVTESVIDTVPPVLTVTQPYDRIYSSRRIPFNLTATEKVTFMYKNLDSTHPRWKTLRARKESYEGSRWFTYGSHDIQIMAVDEAGNSDITEVHFTIEK